MRQATIGLLGALMVTACATDQAAFDPVSMDLAQTDEVHRPAMRELAFKSDGASLNGQFFLANGAGPHPTVVLLHGFPGNEKNLDLAQTLRRSGFNVLFFHYRGAWGSEGDFSFSNVLEDVTNAVEFVRTEADEYRVDPSKVILIGHSMGGFAALHGAASDGGVSCVAGIAAADLGVLGAALEADAEMADGFAESAAHIGSLNGFDGDAAVDDLISNKDVYSLMSVAPGLRGKSVLLIAGAQDEVLAPEQNHAPMVEGFRQEGVNVDARIIDGDHSFSWTRIKLQREIAQWVEGCR